MDVIDFDGPQTMKAMIFAAGLGTRLKPLTDTMPKALVPVCGQPLLYHVLTKLVTAGYDDIIINVHHFPDQIIDYLCVNDFGAKITISDERDFLRETGGGIKHVRPLLDSSTPPSAPLRMTKGLSFRPSEASLSFRPSEARGEIFDNTPFLVHNVDIISNLDLKWLREQHREDAVATVVVSERETQRYLLFDDDDQLKGWTNVKTGEVRSPFGDIDPDRYRKLAFAGIHLMSPAIFDAFDKLGFGDRFSIMDFYIQACASYPIYAAVPPDFRMVDVGKFDTLPEAEAICSRLLNP
jgi:NDP-sugar pyrophosphorylase family protein